MKCPFVSRSAFDLALERIAALEAELKDERADRRRLTDVITIKSANISAYNMVSVPKEEEEEPEPRKYSPEKDSAEPMIVKRDDERPLTRARDIARRAEQQNMDSAKQMEALAAQAGAREVIRQAKEDGRRDASA